MLRRSPKSGRHRSGLETVTTGGYKQDLEACVGRAQKHAGVAATTGD